MAERPIRFQQRRRSLRAFSKDGTATRFLKAATAYTLSAKAEQLMHLQRRRRSSCAFSKNRTTYALSAKTAQFMRLQNRSGSYAILKSGEAHTLSAKENRPIRSVKAGRLMRFPQSRDGLHTFRKSRTTYAPSAKTVQPMRFSQRRNSLRAFRQLIHFQQRQNGSCTFSKDNAAYALSAKAGPSGATTLTHV